MTVLLLAASMVLANGPAQRPAIVSREPAPPTRWTQSVAFRCPSDSLRISGYGASRPSGMLARILFNGRPLRGAGANALRTDLSHPRAVYRLAARCSRTGSGIGLAIHRGEKGEDGKMTYRAGSVLLTGPRLDDYRGLEPSDSDSFWFR
ncbi:MAG TPA: hypothetical protein VFW19_15395 [Allosphingosinicella sp.]|nr:hypothetical protein [Allosphingosinicella sp.]